MTEHVYQALYKKTIIDTLHYMKAHPGTGIDLNGIFQTSPGANEKKQCIAGLFAKKEAADLFKDANPYLPCNVLKEFLRRLNAVNPFFSKKTLIHLYEQMDAMDAYQLVLKELDDDKKIILFQLFSYLVAIVRNQTLNKMDARNLAIVNAPHLVCSLSNTPELTSQNNLVIQTLIESFDEHLHDCLQIPLKTIEKKIKGWDREIKGNPQLRKYAFITHLKSAIDAKKGQWKTGWFGGESHSAFNEKLPKHIKKIYILCEQLNETNVDSHYETIENIITRQSKGQEGKFFCFNKRDVKTQQFYNDYALSLSLLAPDLEKPSMQNTG